MSYAKTAVTGRRAAALVASALALCALWAGAAQAQVQKVRVETTVSVPLLVDQIAESGFPKDIPVGTQVCAAGEYTYASEVKRYRFISWRFGGVESKDRCVTLAADRPIYTAVFQEEALVQVTSVVPEVSAYQWSVVGSTVELKAPEVVSVGLTKRWRFAGWTAGLTPSSTTNQIVVAKAVTVEARYTAEYGIQVSAPPGTSASGEGWYASGQLATVRTADPVSQGEGKRLRFVRWEVDGIPQGSLQTNLTVLTFTVSSPAIFRPLYSQEYLVTATTPQGTILQGWYAADSLLTVETSTSIEGVRFVRWKEAGSTDPLAQTSRLQLVVDRPLQLQAVYEGISTPPPTGPSPVAILNENAAIPLLVDGVERKDLPATLSVGSRACVSNSLTYTGEGERHRFVGWSNGSSELCQVLAAGTTVVFFEKQVLLRTTSSVKSVETSRWVPADTVVDLDAPAVVEEGGARWTFESWSVGEQPSNRTTRLVMLRPQNVEAKYTAEYLLQLDSVEGVTLSGGGWYDTNTTAIVRTPLHVEQGVDRRLKFVEWQQTGQRPLAVPGLQQQDLSVLVSGPMTLRPKYVQEYLIEALNPQGVLSLSWMEKGKTLELETPAVIDIVEGEERQRFSHWQEQVREAVPLAQLPKLSIPVERPIRLEAVYHREFKLTLAAPYGGSGTGWYAENSTAILSVPPQPQAVLFLKKVFQGYAGYPDTGPVLQVVVQGPMNVGAIYKNDVDFKVLIFVVAGLLGAFLIWRLTERRTTPPPQAASEPSSQPIEEEIIEEVVEEDEDSHPPISTGWRQPPRDDAR